MIRFLTIKGLKRFKSERLEMRSLTILAGRNGAGKTSALHAILLACHATRRGDGIAELNGPFKLELGWFDDIVNVNAEKTFSITIEDTEEQQAVWTFTQGDTELYANVTLPETLPYIFSAGRERSFQYLSAERTGPRMVQRGGALPQELLEVGSVGEHTAQVLEKLGRRITPGGMRVSEHCSDEFSSIKAQTEQWLSRIVRNVQLDTSVFQGTDVFSIKFRNDGNSPWVLPTNMGFGVTYTLPIIVAALTASQGGIILIENPEAHLHPSSQSEMGYFLAQMASAGLQVVVETHSDHILNGIRRAIGEAKTLSSDDAAILFFEDSSVPVNFLTFTSTGGISRWPTGFFDQYQIDISHISRVRRNR